MRWRGGGGRGPRRRGRHLRRWQRHLEAVVEIGARVLDLEIGRVLGAGASRARRHVALDDRLAERRLLGGAGMRIIGVELVERLVRVDAGLDERAETSGEALARGASR